MNILDFPGKDDVSYVLNTPVKKPKTRDQYLKMCKRFLTEEDYADLCVCILDEDYYNMAESYIQDIVNSYFSFKH